MWVRWPSSETVATSTASSAIVKVAGARLGCVARLLRVLVQLLDLFGHRSTPRFGAGV